MRTIYSAPAYLLEGRAIEGSHGVELYVTYPKARRPRRQRVLSLTLPPEARLRLIDLFSLGGVEN